MKPMYLDKNRLISFEFRDSLWLSDEFGIIAFKIAMPVENTKLIPSSAMSSASVFGGTEEPATKTGRLIEIEKNVGSRTIKATLEEFECKGEKYYFNHKYSKNVKNKPFGIIPGEVCSLLVCNSEFLVSSVTRHDNE